MNQFLDIKFIVRVLSLFIFTSCLKSENLLVQFKKEYSYYSADELKKTISLPNNIQFSKWINCATIEDKIGESFIHLIYRINCEKLSDFEIHELKFNLENHSSIRKVEIENVHKVFYTPNDPLITNQWYLDQINYYDALENWDIPNGVEPISDGILLAAIDTGVDWTHPDLIQNIWQNLDEDADNDGRTIECDGILIGNECSGNWILDPDDLNGIDDDDWDADPTTFIDDLIGWDFVGDSGIADNNPKPNLENPNSSWHHGTHVAGLLSATTNNNIGIASASFNGNIMAIKCSREIDGDDIHIINGYNAILYAAKKGYYSGNKSIINTSWGANVYSSFENDIIEIVYNNYNGIIVSSAGNGQNNVQYHGAVYPAGYENSISVAPLGQNDIWNHWAHYHNTINISAPGESIISTVMGNEYSNFTGSSQASPIVASSIGLLASLYPNYENFQLRRMILETSDPIIYSINDENYLFGKLGEGRLDLNSALQTPLFPEIILSTYNTEVIDDFDGIISAGDSVEITLNISNLIDWGTADSLEIIPYSNNNGVFIEEIEIVIPTLSPGETLILNNNILKVSFESNLSSGIYFINFIVNANHHLPGIPYSIQTSIPLFIFDYIYYGDINDDHNADILDILIAKEIINGNLSNYSYLTSNCNLNFDDSFDIEDMLLMVNKLLTD